MMCYEHRQRGAVLVVSLLLLIVMTLLAVTAINISSVNLRIVGNMQLQQEAEANAQQAIEVIMGDVSYFTNFDTTETVSVDSQTVNIAERRCIGLVPATDSEYSANIRYSGIIPEYPLWVVDATLNDSATGAKAELHQGVKIKMTAGNCEAANT